MKLLKFVHSNICEVRWWNILSKDSVENGNVGQEGTQTIERNSGISFWRISIEIAKTLFGFFIY